MLCPSCGADVGDEIKLCERCEAERQERLRQEQRARGGTSIDVDAEVDAVTAEDGEAESVVHSHLPGGVQVTEHERWALLAAEERFAGFFPRMVAAFVDVAIANVFVNVAWLVMVSGVPMPYTQAEAAATQGGLLPFIIAGLKYFTFLTGASLPYYVCFHASALAATPGKMLLSLIVTTEDGARLTVVDAILRELAKLVSAAIAGFGFLMMLATPKRQTLHDRVAHAVVLEREELRDVRVLLSLVFASFFFVGTFLLFHTTGHKIAVVPNAVERAPVSVRDSVIRIGEHELSFPAVRATYDRDRNVIEIAFAKTPPLLERPDASVLLRLRDRPRGGLRCEQIGFSEYELKLFTRPNGFVVPNDELRMTIGGDSGPAVGTSMEQIQCSLNPLGDIQGLIRGSRVVLNGEQELRVVWELNVKGALQERVLPSSFRFTTADVAESIALLRHDEHQVLEIGFFSKKLDDDQRKSIRASGSLRMLDGTHPDVVLALSLKPGVLSLAESAVRTYGVIFVNGERFRLPATEPELGFFYAGAVKLAGLEGRLSDGERVRGKVQNEAKKLFGEVESTFAWDLDFEATVIDRAVSDVAAQQRQPIAEDKTPVTNTGKVSVGESSSDLQGAFALFYPAVNRVTIGFYAEQLTDEDRAELAKRKSLAAAVSDKKPVMLLSLDFAVGATEASRSAVSGYTVYFNRSGYLIFPGMHDSISTRRIRENLDPAQFTALNGALKSGSRLRIKARGIEEIPRVAAGANWEISYELPIVGVE